MQNGAEWVKGRIVRSSFHLLGSGPEVRTGAETQADAIGMNWSTYCV